MPGLQQVELDAPGDVGHGGLVWLAGGEAACLLGLAGTGPVRAVTDEEAGHEDLQQERREREIQLVRGKSRDRAGRGLQGVREADPVRGDAHGVHAGPGNPADAW